MEISSHIYEINDVPEEISKQLFDDIRALEQLLGIVGGVFPSEEAFLNEFDEYPPAEFLSPTIVDKINYFSQAVFKTSNESSEFDATEDDLLFLYKVGKLLSEQLDYLEEREEGCKIWFITAELNERLYGGTFVFWNANLPGRVVMQGISRFFIPTLLNFLYPEQNSVLPRLNSIIQPAVETVARIVDAKQIYVFPVGKQGSILVKHYGFRRTPDFRYPCKFIKGEEYLNPYNDPSEFEFYVKDIPE